MIEMEQEVVSEVLADASRRAQEGEIWLARCDQVAAWMEMRIGTERVTVG